MNVRRILLLLVVGVLCFGVAGVVNSFPVPPVLGWVIGIGVAYLVGRFADQPTQSSEDKAAKPAIGAEMVLGCVVVGCFIVAVLGILRSFEPGERGLCLLASAVAFGVVSYIYNRES